MWPLLLLALLFCSIRSPPGDKAEDDLAAGLLSIAHGRGTFLPETLRLATTLPQPRASCAPGGRFFSDSRSPLLLRRLLAFTFAAIWDVNEDTMTHRSKGNRFGALQEPNNSFSLV